MIEVIHRPRQRTGPRLARLLLELGGEGVINWTGAPLPNSLNAHSRTDKLHQLIALELRGVPVPRWSLVAHPEWLPRTRFHQQGRDLTSPPLAADFYVERSFFPDEWRIHVIGKRILRSGVKLPKTANAHPWIKSHRLGWKISYIGGAPEPVKKVALRAVKALRLDFGAVDVGVKEDGSPVVFEVNTCPGLDSGTLRLYVRRLGELCRDTQEQDLQGRSA